MYFLPAETDQPKKKKESALLQEERSNRTCSGSPQQGSRNTFTLVHRFTDMLATKLTFQIRPVGISISPSLYRTRIVRQATFLPRTTLRSAHASASPHDNPSILALYTGPLAKTFYRLKLFSLGSLGMASSLCPILLFAPGEIGLVGRLGLCATALATSGAGTSLIAWVGKPYVSQMRLLAPQKAQEEYAKDVQDTLGSASAAAAQDTLASSSAAQDTLATSTTAPSAHTDSPAIEVLTTNWRLRPLRTIIYEPSTIRPTSRPFAAWELAAIPPAKELPSGSGTVTQLVASTRDAKTGALLGRRWAIWNPETVTMDARKDESDKNVWKSEGKTAEEGTVCRYFSIHEELLGDQWRVI